MRHEFSFDPEHSLVRVNAAGVMTPATFERQFQDLIHHPQWRRGMKILSDYRGIDGSGLTTDDVRAMASVYAGLADRIGPGRSALVVNEALQYGLARMWVSWAEMKIPREVRVFTSMEEARRWVMEDEGEAPAPSS